MLGAFQGAVVSKTSEKDVRAGGTWLPSVNVPMLDSIATMDSHAAELLVKALDIVSADLYFSPGMRQSHVMLSAVTTCALSLQGAK